MTDASDRIAHLLSAAGHATDRSLRLAYLAEARAVLAREAERQRELARLLENMESDVVRMTQTEMVT